jgi:hypothetical protein
MKAPVFVLGIGHRSGTNYLAHLLKLHPACTSLNKIGEDYLFAPIDLLDDYVESTVRHWNPEWNEGGRKSLLRKCLGNALNQFLRKNSKHPDKIVVTKTPSVRNLDYVFEFMSDARLIIIVRDGQSLTASSLKSFGGSFGETVHRWKTSAEKIEQFIAVHGECSERHAIVKYEDLFSHTEDELHRLFAWLDLPIDDYDFAAAVGAPVIGSSDVVADKHSAVHWRPVEKSRSFDPLGRASMLSAYQKSRFAWMAGQVSRRLGYEVKPLYRTNPLFGILHFIHDIPLRLKKALAGNVMRVRRLTNRI